MTLSGVHYWLLWGATALTGWMCLAHALRSARALAHARRRAELLLDQLARYQEYCRRLEDQLFVYDERQRLWRIADAKPSRELPS